MHISPGYGLLQNVCKLLNPLSLLCCSALSYHVSADGNYKPVSGRGDVSLGPGIPRYARKISDLYHGAAVGALTLSNPVQSLFTAGEGCVKIWDISQQGSKSSPVSILDCPVSVPPTPSLPFSVIGVTA